MRIIGGYLKGKKILTPTDKLTRPLKDMVRESIFNIIQHSKNELVNLKSSTILDLFSGSGSFGMECISRGAKKVIFFENYPNSVKVLKKNLNLLKLNSYSKIIEKDAYSISQSQLNIKKFDLIFLDPPFEDKEVNKIINLLITQKIITDDTLVIFHRNSKKKEIFTKNLKIIREEKYGISKILFGKLTI